jgi:hypothetical protein
MPDKDPMPERPAAGPPITPPPDDTKAGKPAPIAEAGVGILAVEDDLKPQLPNRFRRNSPKDMFGKERPLYNEDVEVIDVGVPGLGQMDTLPRQDGGASDKTQARINR